MRKSRKSRRTKPMAQPVKTGPNRRDMLKLMRNGVLGMTVVGGAGYWANGSFKAYAMEHDLSRMGQGAATIVQVHDPQCPTCTALQKQTRAALASFDECGLVYLVADIKTPEGASFAARYGVPHVTLLFFDASGALLETVSGMHSSAELEPILAKHKAVTQA